MLTECIPKLNTYRVVRALRAFFRSGFYSALVVMLMLCSELFGWELPVYYLYFLFLATALMIAEDTLAVVPPAFCGYMTFSAANNPVKFPETSVFSKPGAAAALVAVLVLIGVLLVSRLIFELIKRPRKSFPKLSIGFLVLGLAYVLGGAFTSGYSMRTALFGLVQIVSLCAFYYYLYYTIDWKTLDKGYLFELITIVGVGMLGEVAGMYCNPGVFTASGVNRDMLYTGWGVCNNVGCVMAMCMPAPFYLAAVRKHGWVFSAIGCGFYLGLLLTQSRGSILFGSLVFFCCIVAVLLVSKGQNRIGNAIVLIVVFLALLLFALVFKQQFERLFASLLEDGFNSRGRLKIYQACWETYLQNPSFGVGFYKTPGALVGHPNIGMTAPDGVFLPPRAHNTYLQLLASTGTIGFFAYFYHRFETLALFLHRPTKEKLFIALPIAALLLTSLLDCHFFNFGPAILYSILLVFAEGLENASPQTETVRFGKRKAAIL